MTTLTHPVHVDDDTIVLQKTRLKNWKTPSIFGFVTVLSILAFFIAPAAPDSTTHFRLSTDSDFFQLPIIDAPSRYIGYATAIILAALTAMSLWRMRSAHKTPVWMIGVFAIIAVCGFLTWAAAGATIPVPGLLIGTIALSVPLIFGALGGVISERVGVINVAIEGQLLAGAFVSAVIASVTGNPYIGLVGAMIAGAAVSFVLAAFSIKYFVDQVIVGVVLNVLVTGLTSFLYSELLVKNPALFNSPPRFDRMNIPFLSDIPLIGPVLFRETIVVYLMYVAVVVVFCALFYTRWGLRLRAVGEHPQAADTVGINVKATRFWNVSLAGVIAGLGGAYFTLGSVGAFNKEMTAGAGFIALAAVIFGRWDPLRATLAALLFGFASSVQNVLGIIGSPVPSEFLLMLPYLVTVFAVAGLVGRVRGPAAAGKPYVTP